EGLGDHGEQEHGLFVYDEAIHVPLIVKQESNVGAGRRVAALMQHIDLVPTILELVKAPWSASFRGRSLKPLLDGTGTLPERSVYSEALYARYHFGWSELTALTDGRYRYIKAPREELYDLEHDGREQTNIADERAQARQAMRIDRYDQAIDAYKHYIALKPHEPAPYVGAAAAFLKLRRLDEAKAHAQLAADVSAATDRRSRASAHEMLAKIALARHDTDAAREEAGLAREADPTLPLPIFIDARLLYDQAKYEDALPLFEQASADLKKSTLQITELHFYTADTLARLDRYDEAEFEF